MAVAWLDESSHGKAPHVLVNPPIELLPMLRDTSELEWCLLCRLAERVSALSVLYAAVEKAEMGMGQGAPSLIGIRRIGISKPLCLSQRWLEFHPHPEFCRYSEGARGCLHPGLVRLGLRSRTSHSEAKDYCTCS